METIHTATYLDLHELLPLFRDLWPDDEPTGLHQTLTEILSSNKFRIWVSRQDTTATGFIYVSIRYDYVEGADHSPTGFVEGIYVRPAFRKNGIAYRLLQAGEQWLREAGCRQIGSDMQFDNQMSFDFHHRAGFVEAGRLITFIKDL
ncbi:aminoglycoside 6'-N-acetyltransferase [Mucilaginibacter sp. PAMB04274]|uniref:aminoglycoside 6'-N-acetyltransferase n=1 Tax=Mucilaginibacter sp. PAMB04274 TaxID=3138568 RepID=UPI0031F64B05